MNLSKIGIAMLVLPGLFAFPASAITFELIGPGGGFQDISGNGSRVLLFDGNTGNAYIWVAGIGLNVIGNSDYNSPIYEISYDGASVVGTLEFDAVRQASVWTEAGGWRERRGPPTAAPGGSSSADTPKDGSSVDSAPVMSGSLWQSRGGDDRADGPGPTKAARWPAAPTRNTNHRNSSGTRQAQPTQPDASPGPGNKTAAELDFPASAYLESIYSTFGIIRDIVLF